MFLLNGAGHFPGAYRTTLARRMRVTILGCLREDPSNFLCRERERRSWAPTISKCLTKTASRTAMDVSLGCYFALKPTGLCSHSGFGQRPSLGECNTQLIARMFWPVKLNIPIAMVLFCGSLSGRGRKITTHWWRQFAALNRKPTRLSAQDQSRQLAAGF